MRYAVLAAKWKMFIQGSKKPCMALFGKKITKCVFAPRCPETRKETLAVAESLAEFIACMLELSCKRRLVPSWIKLE